MTDTAARATDTPATPAPVTPTSDPVTTETPDRDEPRLDIAEVTAALLGTWAETRLEAREMIKDPAYWRIDGLSKTAHRERVTEQTRLMAHGGAGGRAYPEEYGGGGRNGANLAGFEELVLADPSLQIKSGVQWGLFGSAVLQLGTKTHHDRWLTDIMEMRIPGAFAMTETGHGSDVQSLATTATYDPETEEFVIHTPFRAAWKDYLGNAAVDATAATVFAQLITNGVNYGVHAFFVPIRDENGLFLPGIGGEDDGVKGGLNGVDNGRLHFTQVRIPRDNLLNRYGDVAADGTYSSPIASPGRRFFTMLGALVQGRVSLDGSAIIASALALTIAVTYGNERRQFDAGLGTGETALLDYGNHQRRLLPRIATTYAEFFAHDELLVKFDEVFSGANDSEDNREDLETLAASLKSLSTWNALDIIQESREACGGAGYLAENRLVTLRQDLDVFVTFEGDNTILLQLAGRRLLADYAAQFKGKNSRQLATFAVGETAGKIFHGAGLRQLGQTVSDHGSTARSVERGLREDDQRELLTDRVERMIADLAGRLRHLPKDDPQAAFDLMQDNQVDLIAAARAHAELLQWEAFTDALHAIDDADTAQILTWLRDLFGLTLIEKNLAWFMMNGRLSGQRAIAVGSYIRRLCKRLRPHAADLVAAYGFAPEHVRAPIASGAERQRQDEARAYIAEQERTGQAPKKEPRPPRS